VAGLDRHAEPLAAALTDLTDRPSSPVRRSSAAWWGAGMAAAVVAVILGLHPGQVAETVYVTGAGEQRALVLQDGTHVALNSRSRISVRFERGYRAVTLAQGEAAFEVVHDANRPFEVKAGDEVLRDLGTEFDVVCSGGRSTSTVRQGLVDVRPEGDITAFSLGPATGWNMGRREPIDDHFRQRRRRLRLALGPPSSTATAPERGRRRSGSLRRRIRCGWTARGISISPACCHRRSAGDGAASNRVCLPLSAVARWRHTLNGVNTTGKGDGDSWARRLRGLRVRPAGTRQDWLPLLSGRWPPRLHLFNSASRPNRFRSADHVRDQSNLSIGGVAARSGRTLGLTGVFTVDGGLAQLLDGADCRYRRVTPARSASSPPRRSRRRIGTCRRPSAPEPAATRR